MRRAGFLCRAGAFIGVAFGAALCLAGGAQAQAQANGALAQMGNLGNTLGTPVLLWVLSWGGYGAMIWTAILVFAGGFAMHGWMALRRRRARPA